MERKVEHEDAWVVARIAALERANRRLWVTLGALLMVFVSLGIAGAMFAAQLELPNGVGGALKVDDLEIRRALRVVDEEGHDLIWLGREPERKGSAGGQAVLGLFAPQSSGATEQTVRIATSPLGSGLSLSTPDGSSSTSLFAGTSGVSLELRRGSATRSFSEKSDAGMAVAAAPPAVTPAAAPAGRPASDSAKAEAVALAARAGDSSGNSVDLTNPALQALGSGFFVSPISVMDANDGLRVRGRILNTTSVDQLRADFRLVVGGREVVVGVSRIDAGASAPFAVDLPHAGSANVKAARMRWERSTVAYAAD
jgi:hypothetical protein